MVIVSFTPAGRVVSNFCRWTILVALAIRRVGQPPPAHFKVILAPAGARTVSRVRWAPPTVSTPLTRTIGNGLIIRAARSPAPRTPPRGAVGVATGWATGSTVVAGTSKAGGSPTVPPTPPIVVATGVAVGVGVLLAAGVGVGVFVAVGVGVTVGVLVGVGVGVGVLVGVGVGLGV